MSTATRSISFRLYTDKRQQALLERKHTALKDLWNAALEKRIGARSPKISRRALKRARKELGRRHAKVAARRKDFLHKTTARLARLLSLIGTETLTVRNLTRSARGTVEAPGRNVAQKAGLNRSILDTAPATFLNMLRYKAEETGTEILEADTRRLKPSQRCPDCDAVRKKPLSLRTHDCACGCQLGRDEAAALVLLRWAMREVEARLAAFGPAMRREQVRVTVTKGTPAPDMFWPENSETS